MQGMNNVKKKNCVLYILL